MGRGTGTKRAITRFITPTPHKPQWREEGLKVEFSHQWPMTSSNEFIRWASAVCACSFTVMSNSLRPHGLLPGSSVHGILQARILEMGWYFLLQGIFLTQVSNPHLFRLLHLYYVPPAKPLSSVSCSSKLIESKPPRGLLEALIYSQWIRLLTVWDLLLLLSRGVRTEMSGRTPRWGQKVAGTRGETVAPTRTHWKL